MPYRLSRRRCGCAGRVVLVAIVTTLMATSVFEWVYGRHRERLEDQVPESICEGARRSGNFVTSSWHDALLLMGAEHDGLQGHPGRY